MSNWNFADILEQVALAIPSEVCQIQGDRVETWAEFDARANALAADLLEVGLSHQSKVAAYLYNSPEYLETYVAAFKAGAVPVNTNYRYGPEEVQYLFSNSDAEAVVFHGAFAPLLGKIKDVLPQVKRWYMVDDGTSALPDWAVAYESVVAAVTGRTIAPWGRSGDDLLMLYTGGTTGMPKGVMWRQDDLFNVLGSGGNPLFGFGPLQSVEEAFTRTVTAGPRVMPGCPLMHGTGQFSALMGLVFGGAVVSAASRHFSATEMLDEIERHRVNSLIIVGDAFAKPLLAELNAAPGSRDLSCLQIVISSGVMWSQETKAGLLSHLPTTLLVDSFGSSEAVGMGQSVSAAGKAESTARFMLGDRVKVFTDEGEAVLPGSDKSGFVAIGGFIPLGYYKDEEKSAKTFRTIDGVRYSVPGDYALVNADGSLQLLGRGSVCINTGGEKVFPEEVEEALKRHDSVHDAVCVGLPDDRFGEVICAVIETTGPGVTIDEQALVAHVREHLAHYKAPRLFVTVPTIGRAANGKVDYKGLKETARAVLDR
jgi:acyl-CoA synthetase (AMP-forming)/AMP-acid ligase II